jgi:hypothetical protein
MFRWLERTFPGGRLYGPYDHGGRRYYQWMIRGVHLRELMPLLGERITPDLDEYAFERFEQMRHRYPGQLGTPSDAAPGGGADATTRPSIFSELHETEDG